LSAAAELAASEASNISILTHKQCALPYHALQENTTSLQGATAATVQALNDVDTFKTSPPEAAALHHSRCALAPATNIKYVATM
jgi:hypothetical protein